MLIALIILSIAATGAFADDSEKNGFIKVTTGIGYGSATYEGERNAFPGGWQGTAETTGSGFTVLQGIDFVHPYGITMGLKYYIITGVDVDVKIRYPGGTDLEEEDGISKNYFTFGLGYTFDGGVWCAGAKFMFLYNDEAVVDHPKLNVGLNFDGTFWFLERMGVTGFFDIYFLRAERDYNVGVFPNAVKITETLKGSLFFAGLGISLKF